MARSRRAHREPTVHWVLLAAVLVVLVTALLVSGVVNGQVGEGEHAPPSEAGTEPVPPALVGGGPVVDPTRPEQPGLSIPRRHVVLTFDDGPTEIHPGDPRRAAGADVPATFFVLGARAAARPDLIRRMHAEGHEVGVHTFTHVNLANVPPRRLRLELEPDASWRSPRRPATPPPVAAAVLLGGGGDSVRRTGRRSERRQLPGRLHRPGHAGLGAARRRRRSSRPGCRADGQGAVVMLHDGGGDRSQTVAAVDRLITRAAGARLHVRHGHASGRAAVALASGDGCSAIAGRTGQRGRTASGRLVVA